MWAGVKKVIIGVADPNPTVRGGGVDALSKEGIEVEIGLLEEECYTQMSSFMHWCEHRRPHVLLKAATDNNGRIDGDPEKPAVRFSTKKALEMVHEIRRDSMAIIVGVNTVIRDDPKLTVRGIKSSTDIVPKRVVIDPNNRIPIDCQLMTTPDAETYLINAKKYDATKDMAHVNRIVLPTENGNIDVKKILHCLGDLEVQTLLVEGGLETWKRFLEQKLVDSAHLCISNIELDAQNGDYFYKSHLEEAGLVLKEEITLGNDIITKWERN
jgi:diaminohydroxyphosphoribosylaminopyrimidine deaminase/5-amino-6-(5-phosphoribosylamino)uracil reductase